MAVLSSLRFDDIEVVPPFSSGESTPCCAVPVCGYTSIMCVPLFWYGRYARISFITAGFYRGKAGEAKRP